ncbi:hypothetical protein ACIHFE_32320 [Streptomyces sp. NPDC052396]|uniref:hypothetical protein n=1 Tax=Streptomyces sp. NPDC052396 TaxID=3365689 RepID=UPI0037D4C1C9
MKVLGVGATGTIGSAVAGALEARHEVVDDEISAGLRGKLPGQVALARRAVHHLRDGGSIALTGAPSPHP